MISTTAKLLVIAACTSLAACTTLRPVTGWQSAPLAAPAEDHHRLKPGGHVTVTTIDNMKAELDFASLTALWLVGSAAVSSYGPVGIPGP